MIGKLFSAELMKLKRSSIVWVLALVYWLAPLMLGFMMSILKNPELGRRMGLLTAKAELTVGSADWPTYLALTSLLFAAGMIVLAVVDAYIFGREYAEGTAKNMLTLPVGRGEIVIAKLSVSALWFVCMAAVLYVEALLIGFALGLPGFAAAHLAANAVDIAKLVLEVFLLSSAGAGLTVVSRGYLAPVGFGVLLLLVGDLFAHTGWGPWVPWSIVLLSAGAGGHDAPVPGAPSLLLLALFFVVCAAAAYVSMERTDNAQ